MVTATFPDADILGVKLVNGRPTKAVVEITNSEAGPITVAFLAGTLHSLAPLAEDAPAYQSIVRNLTAVQYNLAVGPGEKKAVPFDFALDMQPQDVKLQLTAVVAGSKGDIYQVQAFNDMASIVEAPTSFLDPQMYVNCSTCISAHPKLTSPSVFLYVVISATFAGILYFVYKTWIEALFPQAKRVKTPKKARKTVDADAALSGSESTAVSTPSGKYDQSWIPDHHINRPSAKRVKSGASKKKAE